MSRYFFVLLAVKNRTKNNTSFRESVVRKQAFIGQEIEDILLAIAGSAKFGEFKDAFDWYIDLSEEAVKPVPPLFWLLICLAVGMVIGLIITNSMASKNYSVHKKETAADYVREGTLMITGRNDIFRNTRVNVTPKPKSNSGKSSDSNGSTHTSSSGRSHGGGSISF